MESFRFAPRRGIVAVPTGLKVGNLLTVMEDGDVGNIGHAAVLGALFQAIIAYFVSFLDGNTAAESQGLLGLFLKEGAADDSDAENDDADMDEITTVAPGIAT